MGGESGSLATDFHPMRNHGRRVSLPHPWCRHTRRWLRDDRGAAIAVTASEKMAAWDARACPHRPPGGGAIGLKIFVQGTGASRRILTLTVSFVPQPEKDHDP